MVSKFNKYDVTSEYRGLKDDTKPLPIMETESGFDYERISNNVWSPDTYDGENTED